CVARSLFSMTVGTGAHFCSSGNGFVGNVPEDLQAKAAGKGAKTAARHASAWQRRCAANSRPLVRVLLQSREGGRWVQGVRSRVGTIGHSQRFEAVSALLSLVRTQTAIVKKGITQVWFAQYTRR